MRWFNRSAAAELSRERVEVTVLGEGAHYAAAISGAEDFVDLLVGNFGQRLQSFGVQLLHGVPFHEWSFDLPPMRVVFGLPKTLRP